MKILPLWVGCRFLNLGEHNGQSAGSSRTIRWLVSLPSNILLSRDSGFLSSVHNLQLSLPVQNPEKLIDEAKNILDKSSEVPNIRMTSDDEFKEKDEVVGDMAVQYPRGQRPGLQRKRARFSLLPITSQPTVNFESSLDFDKDPEEYFLAFERRQNAQKEIARQTGRSFTSSDQYNVFKVPRSERPGIPGRSKKAKYKHFYSALPSQNTCQGDVLSNGGLQKEASQPDLASQETEPDNVESPQLESTNVASGQTGPETVATEEPEMTGSIAKAEKTVDQLIDELLADGYGDLEGHRAINLLEEHLQIKPLHLKKLNLPEMEDVPKLDFKPSEVNLPKSSNILSDISNLLVGTKSGNPMKLKNMKILVPSFGSPTPPRSPLASLSLLNKLMFQSNPIRDPFSSICTDQSPRIDDSPVENINKCSNPVDSEKACCNSDKLKSLTTKEDDVQVDGRSSTEVATEDYTSSFEKLVNGISTSLDSGSGIDNKESGSELEGNGVGISDEFMNEKDAHVDHHKNGHDDLGDIVEDVMPDAEASAEPNENIDHFPVDTSKSTQIELDPSVVENQSLDVGSAEYVDKASVQTQDMAPSQATSLELQTERMSESSMRSTNEITKGKSRSRRERKNKNLSSRQSLEKHVINGTLTSLGYGSGIDTRESGSELEGNGVSIGDEFMNENLNREDAYVDRHKDGLNDLGDTVEDVMPDAEASAEPNENTDYFPVDTSKSNQNELDPSVVENQSMDDRSDEYVGMASVQTQDMVPEQTQATSLELQTERMTESSVRSKNEITKGKSCPRSERRNKNLLSRQSLAGCGLSWETGVRRSTRIISRPLEYWRGERFLYGRIHKSLPTVIGVKYESPGKGVPAMKVKSFVSEEHKHLVDQAAL